MSIPTAGLINSGKWKRFDSNRPMMDTLDTNGEGAV